MNKIFFVLFFIHICLALRPTHNQVVHSAELSEKIYTGAMNMGKTDGEVIKYANENTLEKDSYAIWKKKDTGDCYVVVRGTRVYMKLEWINPIKALESLYDILTDLNYPEVYDSDIGAYVHNGVKLRGDWIMGHIGNTLEEKCKSDIIFTGHSLGGAVANYIYLKFRNNFRKNIKKTFLTSLKMKLVMFGAPKLISSSTNPTVKNFGDNVYWYKYNSDIGNEIVSIFKGPAGTINKIFKSTKSKDAELISNLISTLSDVHYGEYAWGKKCRLNAKSGFNALCDNYENIWWTNGNVMDHNMQRYIKSLTYNGRGETKKNVLKKSGEENIVDIETIKCENTDGYNLTVESGELYLYEVSQNYIAKRVLDNGKEVEYAVCGDHGFYLKQCNSKCECHIVTKNDRPKEITMCTSGDLEGPKNCYVDGEIMSVDTYFYHEIMSETKIKGNYLVDYYCHDDMYQRGNYEAPKQKAESKTASTFVTLLFVVLLMLI